MDLSCLKDINTTEGINLKQLSDKQPMLLVFLRQFGCTFCREAMSDLAKIRSKIEQNGVKLVFVHLGTPEDAVKYFKKYNLTGSPSISDPEGRLYQLFGLKKGTFSQLFGLKVWMRGMKAGVGDGHGLGWMMGDAFQMPGIFMIFQGSLKASYLHQSAADRPDYFGLAECCFI